MYMSVKLLYKRTLCVRILQVVVGMEYSEIRQQRYLGVDKALLDHLSISIEIRVPVNSMSLFCALYV